MPERLDPYDYVAHLFEKAPKMSSVEAEQVLTETYEDRFRVYPHFGPTRLSRPLSSVALHDTEENSQSSALFELMRLYLHHGIGELFKVSWETFSQYPKEYVYFMFELAATRAKELEKATRAGLNGLTNPPPQ